jgi:DNA polymerase-3 subunit delta'
VPFSNIKGQDKPIQILKRYIEERYLTGSYLFVGEEGIGKKTVARTLARALNCQNETLDSCDRCASCLKIEKDQHPDVHFLSTETVDSIKIEYIRQLQKEINLKPYTGEKKVFIIDDAHNLTAEAANALLKTLEEPPKDSLLILVSAKPALLFKTIISRCKILRFYPIQRNKLEKILREDFQIDNPTGHFLAYFCEGRLGSALKLKDTDIFSQKNRIIDGFALAKKAGEQNFSDETRNDVRRLLNILAGWFRDMYLAKIGMPYNEFINLDRKDELLKTMHRYTLFDLEEILNSLSNTLLYLEQNINTKLLLSNLRWSLAR